jgi:hypothetical protein
MAKMDLSNGQVTDLAYENGVSYTLSSSVAGKIYYTKTTTSTEAAYIYYNTLGSNFDSSETKLTNNDYTQFVPYSQNLGIGVIMYDSDSKAIYKKSQNDVSATLLAENVTVSNFIGVHGNNVYYIADSNIFSCNFVTNSKPVNITSDFGTIKSDSIRHISIIGSKIFYLKEYSNANNTAYYLHMNDSSIIDDETDKAYDHFIGVLDEADYLTEPTE